MAKKKKMSAKARAAAHRASEAKWRKANARYVSEWESEETWNTR